MGQQDKNKSQVVIDKETIKTVIIVILVILGFIYFYHKGSTGEDAGQPDTCQPTNDLGDVTCE